MEGNLIDMLIESCPKDVTAGATKGQPKDICNHQMFCRLMQYFGRNICMPSTPSNGSHLLCLLSCFFSVNITTIYFTKAKKHQTQAQTFNVHYKHHALKPKGKSFISHVVCLLCAPDSNNSTTNDAEMDWYICLKKTKDGVVEGEVTDYLSKTLQPKQVSEDKTPTKESPSRKRFNESVADATYWPLVTNGNSEQYPDALYPHSWMIMYAMMDNFEWPSMLIAAYVATLNHFMDSTKVHLGYVSNSMKRTKLTPYNPNKHSEEERINLLAEKEREDARLAKYRIVMVNITGQ